MKQWLSILLFAFVAGCSHTPPQPLPANIALHIESSMGLNPDPRGRSSPVVVRIYELRTATNFEGMSFFDIQDRDATVLGNDLIAREELILRPGEGRVIVRKGSPDTRYIGIVASYRDLERSVWRATAPAPSAAQTRRLSSGIWPFRSTEPYRYSITLERNAVYIAPLARND